jgi:NADH-quinone oxidoreductase subunit A
VANARLILIEPSVEPGVVPLRADKIRLGRSRDCDLVFDVEAVYFYPWGANFRELGLPGLIALGVFTIPLVVGLAYEWAKGSLEW